MFAVVIDQPGDPDVMAWREVSDPTAAAGQVVIDVTATAVNRADLLQRQGFYPPPPGASPYLGLECSGTIRAVGAGVLGWAVGDECVALLDGGGYAEQVAVAAGQLMPLPTGIALRDAAALPEVAATVWSNLFMSAALQPDELLLIHGGTSGIGTFAIQLAKAQGALVGVTAGSEAKLAKCAELGADILINYRDDDFVTSIAAASDGHGADVILDNMGAKYLARNVETLAVNGRLVVIGLQGGAKAELDIGLLLRKRAALIATSLRRRPAAEKATICAAVVENVWPLIAAGHIRPIIDRHLPVAEANIAHRLLEASEHVGKVVLDVAVHNSLDSSAPTQR